MQSGLRRSFGARGAALAIRAVMAMAVRAQPMLLCGHLGAILIRGPVRLRLVNNGRNFQAASEPHFGPACGGVGHRSKGEHHHCQNYGQGAQGKMTSGVKHRLGAPPNIGSVQRQAKSRCRLQR